MSKGQPVDSELQHLTSCVNTIFDIPPPDLHHIHIPELLQILKNYALKLLSISSRLSLNPNSFQPIKHCYTLLNKPVPSNQELFTKLPRYLKNLIDKMKELKEEKEKEKEQSKKRMKDIDKVQKQVQKWRVQVQNVKRQCGQGMWKQMQGVGRQLCWQSELLGHCKQKVGNWQQMKRVIQQNNVAIRELLSERSHKKQTQQTDFKHLYQCLILQVQHLSNQLNMQDNPLYEQLGSLTKHFSNNSLQTQLNNNRQQIQLFKDKLVYNMKNEIARWQEQVNNMKREFKKIQKELNKKQKQLQLKQIQLQRVKHKQDELMSLVGQIDLCHKKYQQLEGKYNKVKHQLDTTKQQLKAKNLQLEQRKIRKNQFQLLLNQKVEKEEKVVILEKALREIEKKYLKREKEIDQKKTSLDLGYQERLKQIDEKDQTIHELRQICSSQLKNLQSLEQYLGQFQKKIMQKDQEIKNLQYQKETAQSNVNRFREAMELNERDITRLGDQMKRLFGQMKRLEEQCEKWKKEAQLVKEYMVQMVKQKDKIKEGIDQIRQSAQLQLQQQSYGQVQAQIQKLNEILCDKEEQRQAFKKKSTKKIKR